MRKNATFLAVAAVVLSTAAIAAPAAAQGEKEAAGPSIRPVEIYGCVYRDGKGLGDLQQAADKFNAWMDSTGQQDYWAYILVPYFRSSELKFDVLWAGGWRTGADMAKGMERWVTDGGALSAEFDKVVKCDTTTNFAVMDLSKEPKPPASGPVSFENCTVAKGRKFTDALAAMNAWAAYEKEHGIEADHFVLFPAFGETSDADYTFKWVTTSSWADFGKSYDQYGTGGGWKKSEELFDNLLDCDSARVYVGMRVRSLPKPK